MVIRGPTVWQLSLAMRVAPPWARGRNATLPHVCARAGKPSGGVGAPGRESLSHVRAHKIIIILSSSISLRGRPSSIDDV